MWPIMWVISCYKQLYFQPKRRMALFVVHLTPSQSERLEYLENGLSLNHQILHGIHANRVLEPRGYVDISYASCILSDETDELHG